ncbi:MAG: M48 family metallopeptidase [Pseudomonadales bacterium]|jgi:predicted Zn-dependent protease|nr:M48 family metallopeptidase [Pseudomonadales bacterium]
MRLFRMTTTIAARIGLCVMALGLGACATTTSSGVVGANRQQLLLVSSQEMNQMAAQSYNELKVESQQNGTLNRNAGLLQRVRTVASRLEPQTAVFRQDALSWDWEVNVLQSDELNAFCMPGGKIMFYSGLIQTLNLSDDEIAIVMGHEIAHALREHSREQMSQALVAQGVIGIGASLFGLGQGSTQLAATGYQALIATSFSRGDEAEADRIGLELAARAGYDPRAGVTLWQKMINASGGSAPPQILSSHPASANRIQEIQSLLPSVMPLYEAARR